MLFLWWTVASSVRLAQNVEYHRYKKWGHLKVSTFTAVTVQYNNKSPIICTGSSLSQFLFIFLVQTLPCYCLNWLKNDRFLYNQKVCSAAMVEDITPFKENIHGFEQSVFSILDSVKVRVQLGDETPESVLHFIIDNLCCDV